MLDDVEGVRTPFAADSVSHGESEVEEVGDRMVNVSFGDFDICADGFTVTCSSIGEEGTTSDRLSFELNHPAAPTNDEIALTLSTLCGNAYQSIQMDIAVSDAVLEGIGKFTGAEVTVAGTLPYREREPKNDDGAIILNFSGGFDSLAALAVMPEDTRLVSVDFGGQFDRESGFFKRFDPHILTTNFRQLKHDRNSWTFMGAGALLFSGYLNARYNVFGTILEANMAQMEELPRAGVSTDTPPFASAGLSDIRYTNGLTEVATAMIVLRYMPEMVNDSLVSLGNPGTEKRYRKQTLTSIVSDRFHMPVHYDLTEPPQRRLGWGDYDPIDFLSLYAIKHAGIEEASKTISGIPQEAVDFAQGHRLTFYERLNTNFLGTFPQGLLPDYLAKLAGAGISPYDEEDWKDLRAVVEFLEAQKAAKELASKAEKAPKPRRSRARRALSRLKRAIIPK